VFESQAQVQGVTIDQVLDSARKWLDPTIGIYYDLDWPEAAGDGPGAEFPDFQKIQKKKSLVGI
jgi:hypothetical protein